MKLTARTLLCSILICVAIGLAAWTLLAKADAPYSRYGVPFDLVDDAGAPITEKALEGHPALIYFGYTHCPEVCPTTLYEMAGWMETLGPSAKQLKAYFFTVDPERDTAQVMHSYASNFTDRIVGITGDPQEMLKVQKGWQIFVRRVPGQDGDYTIDHTASVFMVDAKGQLKGTIAYGEDTNSALAKLRALLRQAG